jgi:hypothetical protein
MVRKATWSMLLLLLASVQLLAMTCGVRCAAMAMPDRFAAAQSAMPGMEHCGMSSMRDSARHDVQAVQRCSSGICGDDLAVVKSPGDVAERADIALAHIVDVIFSGSAVLPLPIDTAWPPLMSRSTTVSNLNTLLTNLRV